jgi:hypothetical protein
VVKEEVYRNVEKRKRCSIVAATLRREQMPDVGGNVLVGVFTTNDGRSEDGISGR